MAIGINPVWLQPQGTVTGGSREELAAQYLSRAGAAATSQSQGLEDQRVKELLRGGPSGGVSLGSSGGGMSGGGGVSYKPPTGQTVISTPIAPKGPVPTMEDVPDLVVPEYDEAFAASETRKAVSAPLRSLRRQTREAIMRHLDTSNPALRREYTRAAIRGHGEALSQIYGAAQKEGRSAAERRQSIEAQAAYARFQAAQNRASLKYQAAMGLYQRKFGTQQTSKNEYGSTSGGIKTPQVAGGEMVYMPGIGYTTRSAMGWE